MTDNATDKTATARLRELLDERGVEWKDYRHENHTWWSDSENVGWHAENRSSVNGLYVKIEAVLTPEQAAAATLGDNEKAVIENDLEIMRDIASGLHRDLTAADPEMAAIWEKAWPDVLGELER